MINSKYKLWILFDELLQVFLTEVPGVVVETEPQSIILLALSLIGVVHTHFFLFDMIIMIFCQVRTKNALISRHHWLSDSKLPEDVYFILHPGWQLIDDQPLDLRQYGYNVIVIVIHKQYYIRFEISQFIDNNLTKK